MKDTVDLVTDTFSVYRFDSIYIPAKVRRSSLSDVTPVEEVLFGASLEAVLSEHSHRQAKIASELASVSKQGQIPFGVMMFITK